MVPEGARIAPPALCSHGVRSVDPVGVCQSCKDETPTCTVEGCTEAPTPRGRGTLAGLCADHFEQRFFDEEHRRSLQRDAIIASDDRIAAAYEAIDARGGA